MTQFTIPEGAADPILGYVRQKAKEWTIPQMVDRVGAGLATLEAAASAIPAAQLELAAPGEEWTPLFTIRHVAEINLATATRCLAAATMGDADAVLPPIVPDGREGILVTQRAHLDDIFAKLSPLPEESHPDVHWTHPLLGELTWREWFLTLRVHCLGHAAQLDGMRGTGRP